MGCKVSRDASDARARVILNTSEISQMAGTRGQGHGALYRGISRLHAINHAVKGEM